MTNSADFELLRQVSVSDYVDERTNPSPSSLGYLHLVDVLSTLKLLVPKDAVNVLDYGCGGSPYRNLFKGTYTGADLAGNPQKDVELLADGSLPTMHSGYDVVLSSQVLEHVLDYQHYLREAHRALKQGGILILTTHGMFGDHGSPNDYWRWTTEGLKHSIESCGFEVEECHQMTVGPRATIMWLLHDITMMGSGKNIREIYPFLFWIIRSLGIRRLNLFAEKFLSSFARENLALPHWSTRYVGIAVRAKKIDTKT